MAVRLIIVDDHPVVRDGLRGPHLLHIYAKLEVKDRAAAVATAYKAGLFQR